jgi:uncharacterized protein (DUF488 family)
VTTIFTIGHSTRPIEQFLEILDGFKIRLLADVRTIPGSRFNPQFDSKALEASLASHDIRYLHFAGLGGLRHTTKDSINTGWRNLSFRGYADYMQTPEFSENLEKLMTMARESTTCIMCAEAVPWRCHRSLIGDALLMSGFRVEDIMGSMVSKPHTLTPFAKVNGDSVTYP